MNLAISLVVAVVLAAPSDKQAEWPKADAVAMARQSIAELCGDRLAKAKKPCDKVSLGRELLKVAGESEDDPAAQYILLPSPKNLRSIVGCLDHCHNTRPDRLGQVRPPIKDHFQIGIGGAVAGFTAAKYATNVLEILVLSGIWGLAV